MNTDEINQESMKGYRLLEKGELIQVSDEVEVSEDSSPIAKWQPTLCVGKKAPDPQFIAHRVYRRKIAP
jgi:hypothetical protein